MPTIHSTYAPSGIGRALACPGSLTLPVEHGSGDNEYTRLGTDCHTLAEFCWLMEIDPLDFVGKQFGEYKSTITMGDAVAVKMMIDTVWSLVEEYGVTKEDVIVEQRILDTDSDPDGNDNFGGTVDFRIVTPNAVVIADYKHGEGYAVEVDDNPQLLSYAILALKKHGMLGDDRVEVKILVCQPRKWHKDGYVRDQIVEMESILQFDGKLRDLFALVESGEVYFKTGDHCRWCPSRAYCKKLANQTADEFRQASENPSLTILDFGDRLPQVPAMKGHLASLEAEAKARARSGETIPGFKLVRGYKKREWSDPNLATELLRRCEVDPYKPAVLISPSQAEKLGVPRDVIDELTIRPRADPKLVPESDPREPYDPNQDPAEGFSA